MIVLFYSTDVSTSDLYLANTSLLSQIATYLGMLLAAVMLLPFGLLVLGCFLQFANEGRVDSRIVPLVLLLGAAILSLFCLCGLRLWSGQLLARRLPYLLSQRNGWLSRRSLHQIGPDSQTEWNMEMLQSIRVHRDYLLIRFNPNIHYFDVIPLRSFDRPDGLIALVEELRLSHIPLSKGFSDPRRTMEVAVPNGEPVSEGAVSFSGLVMSDDIRGLPVYRQLRRNVALLVGMGVGIPLLVIGLGWPFFGWVTLGSLIAPWIFLRAYRLSLAPLMKNGARLQFAAGYLDEEKLVMHSFPERSRVQWSNYKSMRVSDSAISLEHKFGKNFYSVLARRQFVSGRSTGPRPSKQSRRDCQSGIVEGKRSTLFLPHFDELIA